MNNTKRIFIATFVGLIAGIMCLGGGILLGATLTPMMIAYILAQRTVMGTMIGLSGLRVGWVANGALIGLLMGILFTLHDFTILEEANLSKTVVSVLPIAGIFYGLFIEFMTTKVFNAPSPYSNHPVNDSK